MPSKLTFPEALQEIKGRFDVLSLVSRYLAVKKTGSSYVAVCPFHNDKSPSMHISPSKGIYKCFACGASGDMFNFLIEYRKMGFAEIVHELAEELGIEIQKNQPDPVVSNENQLILQMHALAAEFYQDCLNQAGQESLRAQNYLKDERKFSQETLNIFQIGLSPNAKFGLYQHLCTKIHEPDLKSNEFLVKSGLFLEDKITGEIIDRFRGRIMIPIYDLESRVVAFGARILDAEVQPKYLNSPETPIYTKGKYLYGLNFAKPFAKSKGQVLLLEGYFDVMQAHQAGVNYAVGSLGTALTKEQYAALYQSNSQRKIIFCFDSDEAGIRAQRAALLVAQESAFSQKPQLLSIGFEKVKDIDEFLLSFSSSAEALSALDELIAKASESYTFVLDNLKKEVEPENTSMRSERARSFIELIQNVKDPIERELLAEKCALTFGFHKSTVFEMLNSFDKQASIGQTRKLKQLTLPPLTGRPGRKRPPVSRPSERKLVALLFLSNEAWLVERIATVVLTDAQAVHFQREFVKLDLQTRDNLRQGFLEPVLENLPIAEFIGYAKELEEADLKKIIEELITEINKNNSMFKLTREVPRKRLLS